MNTIKFKTNINCGSCIKTVTPFLNKIFEIESWEVDTDNPDKILTVKGDITSEEVIEVLKEAGYKAEILTS